MAVVSLLRVPEWLQYEGLILLGWAANASRPVPVVTILWASVYLAAAFSFNAASDWQSDAPQKNPITRGEVSPIPATAISLLLLLCALIFTRVLPLGQRWLGAAMVGTAFAYSLPTLGLKRFPVIGTMANLALFLPLFWLGAAGQVLPGHAMLYGLLLGIPAIQSQLVHEAEDVTEDEHAGSLSTIRWLGARVLRPTVVSLSAMVCVAAFVAALQFALPAAAAGAYAVAAVAVARQPPLRGNWRGRIRWAYSAATVLWLAGWMLRSWHPGAP